MQGLGKGGGGGGGHHGGGGGGHHGGGGGGFRRGGRGGIFVGGSPAYFGPGWGYPYYDDSYPLQVVVPDSCEENVRAGCYKRWGHDAAKMASCVASGYKGCGLQGLGALPGCGRKGVAIAVAAVLAGAAGYFATRKPIVGIAGAVIGAALPALAC